jgi:hypothetical protein
MWELDKRKAVEWKQQRCNCQGAFSLYMYNDEIRAQENVIHHVQRCLVFEIHDTVKWGSIILSSVFFFCGVGLTSPGTAATSGLLYSPR